MFYEYLVSMVQKGRITFANGTWVGPGQPSEQTQEACAEAIDACPMEWEYLNDKGSAGWELVAVDSSLVKGEIVPKLISSDEVEMSGYRILYLKRAV